MRSLVTFTLLGLVFSINVFAQSNTPLFIGVQPNITVEPF